MSTFSWDMDKPEDRARYFWPQEDVRRWWERGWDRDRLEETLRKLDDRTEGALLKGSPASPAAFDRRDTDLERQLETALGGWPRTFGTGKDGNPLEWDPFHLPLFDPTTGKLSPKHPDFEGSDGWSEEIYKLFSAVLLERMKAGMAADLRTPLQGVVLPPRLDLSAPAGDDGLGAAERLSADLSFGLIASGFSMRNRNFVGKPKNGRGEDAVPTFSARNACFGDNTVFWEAHFGTGADFDNAIFGDCADFDEVVFDARALFRWAIFGAKARFGGARFGDDAKFWRADIGDNAFFWDARFGEGTHFEFASFGEGAKFLDAKVGNRTIFRYARFGDNAEFWDAEFGEDVDFEFVRFGEGVKFVDASFGKGTIFRRARFGDGADFWDAEFGDGVAFDYADLTGSSWRGVDLRKFSLKNTTFKDANFTGARIRLDGQDIRGARFGPNSPNPWMAIIRNSSGSALIFNALFLIAFFAPFAFKISSYYIMGMAQAANLLPDEGCTDCWPSVVWKEALGGPQNPWLMGFSLFLLAYNGGRYLYTRRAADLYDEQERSGHAPLWRQYRGLIKYERAFRLLFFVAAYLSLWNFSRWLMEPLVVYGKLP